MELRRRHGYRVMGTLDKGGQMFWKHFESAFVFPGPNAERILWK